MRVQIQHDIRIFDDMKRGGIEVRLIILIICDWEQAASAFIY